MKQPSTSTSAARRKCGLHTSARGTESLIQGRFVPLLAAPIHPSEFASRILSAAIKETV